MFSTSPSPPPSPPTECPWMGHVKFSFNFKQAWNGVQTTSFKKKSNNSYCSLTQ